MCKALNAGPSALTLPSGRTVSWSHRTKPAVSKVLPTQPGKGPSPAGGRATWRNLGMVMGEICPESGK